MFTSLFLRWTQMIVHVANVLFSWLFMYKFHSIHCCNVFVYTVWIFLIGFINLFYSIMSPLQLLVALSGLSVTIVTGQYSYYDFADPPPLPAKGTFLLASMHKQSCTLFSCLPISWYKKHIPGMYTFLLQFSYFSLLHIVNIDSSKISGYNDTPNNLNHSSWNILNSGEAKILLLSRTKCYQFINIHNLIIYQF